MDFSATSRYMDQIWDEEIIPVLTDYIRIPNKSPAFDPAWQAHGHMEKAVTLFAVVSDATVDVRVAPAVTVSSCLSSSTLAA